MTNQQEWNEFLENLLQNAIANHNNSKEGKCLKQRSEQLDEFLSTNVASCEKPFIDDILFEFGLISERTTEVVYKQGLKDCIFLLKNLGVLA